MGTYAKLIEEYRGGILENVHYGYICVVDKDCTVVAIKADEFFHLLFEASNVVCDGFLCHHATHICSARGSPTIAVPPPMRMMGRCPAS